MPRAAETARIAAAVLGVSGQLHDELGEVGVESELAVVDRISAALAGIADLYRGEAVLVVGHQAALGLALARLLPGAGIGLDPGGGRWRRRRRVARWMTSAARTDTSARKNTHLGGDETRLGLPKCSW